MLPDLGVEGDCGVLHTYQQLVPLRNEDNPVIVVWEEKGEVKRETWIEDNEVVTNVDSGHISHDLASTQIRSQVNLALGPTEV